MIHRQATEAEAETSPHQTQEDIDASMRRADEALYRGKAAGRNQVVLEETA